MTSIYFSLVVKTFLFVIENKDVHVAKDKQNCLRPTESP